MADLSIVIVNWNTRELLKDCLNSIFANSRDLILEVFVVDNNSCDGSSLMVREYFPQVHLIENTENIGFAAANNQVFPLCSAVFVMLLNPDTRVVGNTLYTLLEFLKEHPDAGAIGPKVVHPEMRLRVLSCGYQPSLRTIFNQYFGLSSLLPHFQMFRGVNLIMGVHDDQVRTVEWISGACLVVRREIIENVGPLSIEWFMYSEDMEWCQRILDANWNLYHVPTAIIEHLMGASANQNKRVSTMWICSQRSYFINRKHPSRIHLICFDLVMVIGLASRASIYGLRGVVYRQRRVLWQAEWRRFIAYTRIAFQLLMKGGTLDA